MLAELAEPAPDPTPEPVTVTVTYDFDSGDVSYAPNPVPVSKETVITCELETQPSGAPPASFYGFAVSQNWPAEMTITILDQTTFEIADPDATLGTFLFTPTIEVPKGGAGITQPGTVQIQNQ